MSIPHCQSIISRAISKVTKFLESKNIVVSSLSASYASGWEIDPGLRHTYSHIIDKLTL